MTEEKNKSKVGIVMVGVGGGQPRNVANLEDGTGGEQPNADYAGFGDLDEQLAKKMVWRGKVMIVGASALPEISTMMMRNLEEQDIVIAVAKDEDLQNPKKLDEIVAMVEREGQIKKRELVMDIKEIALGDVEIFHEGLVSWRKSEKEKYPRIQQSKKPFKRQDFNNMAKIRRVTKGR